MSCNIKLIAVWYIGVEILAVMPRCYDINRVCISSYSLRHLWSIASYPTLHAPMVWPIKFSIAPEFKWCKKYDDHEKIPLPFERVKWIMVWQHFVFYLITAACYSGVFAQSWRSATDDLFCMRKILVSYYYFILKFIVSRISGKWNP